MTIPVTFKTLDYLTAQTALDFEGDWPPMFVKRSSKRGDRIYALAGVIRDEGKAIEAIYVEE